MSQSSQSTHAIERLKRVKAVIDGSPKPLSMPEIELLASSYGGYYSVNIRQDVWQLVGSGEIEVVNDTKFQRTGGCRDEVIRQWTRIEEAFRDLAESKKRLESSVKSLIDFPPTK